VGACIVAGRNRNKNAEITTTAMTIHLGITFDQNYLSPFYALLMSILEHNRKHNVVIHAIITGVSDKAQQEIRDLIKQNNGDIHFYQIDQDFVSKFVLVSKWTSAVYYRLFFPFLIPEDVERLLYIDTDALVVNDLAELYQVNLQHYPVGAVYDNYVKTAPQLGIEEEGNYFNSGMLLMDIGKWKQQQISEKAMQFLADYPEKIKFVDQDALNAVLKDNWKKLDWKYNTMYSWIPEDIRKDQMGNFIKDKVILHFTLQRPWNTLCRNRYRDLYHHYLQISPAENKQKYTDFNSAKIVPLLKLRALEFYFDHPGIQKVWRTVARK
jgi:lipopolysaccharide biosynthesis glycosyltransferase